MAFVVNTNRQQAVGRPHCEVLAWRSGSGGKPICVEAHLIFDSAHAQYGTVRKCSRLAQDSDCWTPAEKKGVDRISLA
ncbi:hypothetical protein M7I_0029 [Glarea lozoyensis 74030]|uniref:Uncharacterized protein n=1 Tax=Glarea lozoyensis (strain ATCC 74030 / MF5533) TaxID=1104152 RepID=H0EC96_GLAL7|nr:hypothetical protein M7I_0029 [Glarea lozoyensis 74030]